MIKVENIVQCYEEDRKETRTLAYPEIVVCSHWNYSERIVLRLPDGKTYTVIAKDILAAIVNAQNIARF